MLQGEAALGAWDSLATASLAALASSALQLGAALRNATERFCTGHQGAGNSDFWLNIQGSLPGQGRWGRAAKGAEGSRAAVSGLPRPGGLCSLKHSLRKLLSNLPGSLFPK